MSGVAAPIFSGGRLAYCIALGGPAFRFVGNNLAQMTDEITEACEAITADLTKYEL